MKRLLFLFLLIPAFSFAQNRDTSFAQMDQRLQKASVEMIRFHNWFQTGASLEVLGGVVIGVGSINNGAIKNRTPVLIAGAVLTAFGFLINISSSTHIKEAAIILRGNSIVIPLHKKKF